jgi:chromosome segregation ATPase
MSSSDRSSSGAATSPFALLEERVAALSAELGLRDRELGALREALDTERRHAQAVRALVETHLQEAERAAAARAQLEETLAAQRDERVRLLGDYERSVAATEAARHAARIQAADAERTQLAHQAELTTMSGARDAQAAARARAEAERDGALARAGEAEALLAAAEQRIGGLHAELAALRTASDDEHDRLSTAVARAEENAALLHVKLAAAEERTAALEAQLAESGERQQRLSAALDAARADRDGLAAAQASAAERLRARDAEVATLHADAADAHARWADERAALVAAHGEARLACAAAATELREREVALTAMRTETASALAELRAGAERLREERDAARRDATDAATAHNAAERRCAALRADAELRDRQAQAADEMLSAARVARQQLEDEVVALRRATSESSTLHQAAIAGWEADSTSERRERERLQTALRERDAAIDELRASLTASRNECEHAVAARNRAEAERERLQEEMALGGDGDDRRASLEARTAELEAALQAAVEGEQRAAAVLQELNEQHRDCVEWLQAAQDRCQALEGETAAFAECVGGAAAERDAMRAELAAAADERAARQTALEAAQAAIDELRKTAAASAAHTAGLAEECAATAEQLRRAEDVRRNLEERSSGLEQACAALRVELAGAEERTRELVTAHAAAAEEGRMLNGAQVALRLELESTRAELDRTVADLRAELTEALEQRRGLEACLGQREAELSAAAETQDSLARELASLRARLTSCVPAEDLDALTELCEESDHARRAAESERDALRARAGEMLEEREQLLALVERIEQERLTSRDTEQRLLAQVSDSAEQIAAAQADQAALRAARAEVDAEVIALRSDLEARAREGDRQTLRLAEMERAAEEERAARDQLQGQLGDLQEQVVQGAAQLTAALLERDTERRSRATLEAELSETRANAERATAAEREALSRSIATVEAERDALRSEAGSLADRLEALAQECEALRQRAGQAEDGDRQAVEVGRLRLRIEELERQQADAAERHSQAVGLYMLELNQRSDTLQQRDIELQKLTEQMRLLEQACEDGTQQLAALRRTREAVEPHAPVIAGPAGRSDERSWSMLAPADDGAGDDSSRSAARPKAGDASRKASGPMDERAAAIVLAPGEWLTIVHVEEQPALREAVRVEVERCACARYLTIAEHADGDGGQHLLAINLLARDLDPLETICDPRWNHGDPRAFIYLAAGARGVIAGLVDFLPYPIEPDACAARLLERPGGTQRVLMVSDKIEAMNEIRAVLNRVKCSTSLALDGRQAFDLVGMVKPDVVLVDLTLPRGEGLRLVSRLRSDAKTAGIGLVFALGEPFDAGRFRSEAARAVGDCRIASEDLTRALAQVLSEVQTTSDELRAAG